MSALGLFGCGSDKNITIPVTPNQSPPLVEQLFDIGIASDGRLNEVIEHYRNKEDLPALAAVLIHDGQIVEIGATGVRASDDTVQVSTNDLWHLGSISKSMTATLAATLVRDGLIRWDSTMAEVFPELVGKMQPAHEDIRLEELLAHTSGLKFDYEDIPGIEAYFTDDRNIAIQRYEVLQKMSVFEAPAPRGEYAYSNGGYIIAGAMLERVADSSWETLMQEYVFSPLAMNQAGFGAPDTHGILAQPVGHASDEDGGRWHPVDPTTEVISDNAPIAGPANSVHASLNDMANYLSAHLQGARGEGVPGFLAAEDFTFLHESKSDDQYALGWVVNDERLFHDGSNTIWYAFESINIEKNIAIFVATNSYDTQNTDNTSITGVQELVIALESRFDASLQ
ncbi:MAG: serine hydrolase domain-containing protein [Aestuariibacter sp.]